MSLFASMTVGGRPLPTNRTFHVIDPANGNVFAQAPDADEADIDAAVAATKAAFPRWSATSTDQRKAVMVDVACCLRENLAELAAILVREQGKPLPSAKMDILSGAMWCEGMAQINIPREIVEDSAVRSVETLHTPLGVVAAIVPWNFPIGLAFWKIAPALAAGNTVVLKPSPFTPLTTLRIGELLREIIPAGVLNIVSGAADTLGAALAAHPDVSKISFTGSTAIGKDVMRAAADDLKRVTLELGGNDPAIVLDDVDLPSTIDQIFWAAFRNTGQFCVAAKRIYVQDGVFDAFLEAFKTRILAASIGNGFDEDVELGPIQNAKQFERVRGIIDRARRAGFKLLTGDQPVPSQGYFIAPTVVVDPPDDAEVVTEEAFGPVVPVLRFRTLDEGIERANASRYGLAASIWTASTDNARYIADRLECGTVWINEVHHMSPALPFGGHKHSGIGIENGLSGLLEYTNSKTIIQKKT